MLVKKLNSVNEINLFFEESFPIGEVVGDDVHFHAMMIHILDLILGEDSLFLPSFD
jgi:hypothetical protein